MRLLVGNDFSLELGYDLSWATWWVQRIVWFARDGDLIVLPTAPDDSFFDYATALIGVRRDSLKIVVLPRDDETFGNLPTARRLVDSSFVDRLRREIGDRVIEEVVALWPDVEVANLAQLLGVSPALPGAGFIAQDGGRLTNSKTVFRAMAAGVGIPIPEGGIAATPIALRDLLHRLLAPGRPTIVKQDYLTGGRGNEIVSLRATFPPVGARRVVVIDDAMTVEKYAEESWDGLSDGGRNRLVVEEYHRDSRAFFAEFEISDQGVALAGTGEMLSSTFAIGEIMPAVGLDGTQLDEVVEGGRRLCGPLYAMGYRGRLSADAIVTPANEVFFTEYNGRITGSTHIYDVLGKRIIGSGYGKDRIILERVWPTGWSTPSFSAAFEQLRTAGLAYLSETRTGVLLTNSFDPDCGGVIYCIAAPDLSVAWAIDRALKPLFGSRR